MLPFLFSESGPKGLETLNRTIKINPHWWLLIPAGIALVLYAPVWTFDFINWDDPIYVEDNWLLLDASFQGILRIFRTEEWNGNYHPLTLLSYWLDYRIWGNAPMGFHVSNYFLHLLNVLLFFRVFKAISGRFEVGFIVALGMALHPMHAESVAWISGRKDLLYIAFLLLALLAWWRSRKGKHTVWWYALSLLLFGASLLSKGQAVVFPVLVLLVEFLHQRLHLPRVWLKTVPYFALSITIGLLAIRAQEGAEALPEGSAWSFSETWIPALANLWTYLYKVLIPIPLSGLHPYPVSPAESPSSGTVLLALLWFPIGGLIYFTRHRFRKYWFGLLWLLVCLLPVSQLFPVGMAQTADRYSYLSYPGMYAAFAWAFVRFYPQRNYPAMILTAIFGFCICYFSWLNYRYLPTWKTGESFWSQVMEQYPDHHFAHYNKGYFLQQQGETDAALLLYNRALELNPEFAPAYDNRGQLLAQLGRTESALKDYGQAIRFDPGLERSYLNRAVLRWQLQASPQVVAADLETAIGLNPDYTLAHLNLGVLEEGRGNEAKALQSYSKAIESQPFDATGYRYRGGLYLHQQQPQLALADLLRSATLQPKVGQTHYRLAKAYLQLGDQPNAVAQVALAEKYFYKVPVEVLRAVGR